MILRCFCVALMAILAAVSLHAQGSPAYEVNKSGSTLLLNGIQSTGAEPAVTRFCADAHIAISAVSQIPNPQAEIIISREPLVERGMPGAIVTSGNQVINIDTTKPYGFFNGVWNPVFQGLLFSMTVLSPLPPDFEVSAQMAVLDVTGAIPLVLSQAVRLEEPGARVIAGPMFDDAAVAVDFDCPWLDFYGTGYDSVHVSSNGRLVFGGSVAGTLDPSATICEALGDGGCVGYWTDLIPTPGNPVIVRVTTSDVLEVEFNAVPYLGETATVTFTILFHGATSQTPGLIVLDRLDQILPNPPSPAFPNLDRVFMGISPGLAGGASDPGPTPFAPGSQGMTTVSSDMLYDVDSPAGNGLAPSLSTGITRIEFTPMMSGGYTWAAF